MERALVRRAVAEEGDAQAPVPSVRAATASPTACGMPPPTMPLVPTTCRDASAMCIEPPLPPRDAGRLAEDLREHPLGRHAARQQVVVAAVRRRQPVVRAHRAADPDRDALLPDRQVDDAGQLAAREELREQLLELAHLHHRVEQLGVVGRRAHSARDAAWKTAPMPPSMRIVAPLTWVDSGPTSHATSRATSSPCPKRPPGGSDPLRRVLGVVLVALRRGLHARLDVAGADAVHAHADGRALAAKRSETAPTAALETE